MPPLQMNQTHSTVKTNLSGLPPNQIRTKRSNLT